MWSRCMAALKAAKIEAEMMFEEEHSAWMVAYRDPTNAQRLWDWNWPRCRSSGACA